MTNFKTLELRVKSLVFHDIKKPIKQSYRIYKI